MKPGGATTRLTTSRRAVGGAARRAGRPDARVARTQRQLQDAVVELSLAKGFQNVTVEHLLERSGVTRATFYSHFRDKEQLLTSVAEAVVADVLDRFEGEPGGADGRRLELLFEDAARHPERLRVVLRGEGDGVALRHLVQRVSAVVSDTVGLDWRDASSGAVLGAQLAARAYAGQILAVLAWWLDLEDPPAPAAVAADVRLLAERGRDSIRVPTSRPTPRPTSRPTPRPTSRKETP